MPKGPGVDRRPRVCRTVGVQLRGRRGARGEGVRKAWLDCHTQRVMENTQIALCLNGYLHRLSTVFPGYLYSLWNLSRRFKKEFGDLLVTSSSPLCSFFSSSI